MTTRLKQWLCGKWGHDDGAPVYVSRGLRSFGWREERYTCRRCGNVRVWRYMS